MSFVFKNSIIRGITFATIFSALFLALFIFAISDSGSKDFPGPENYSPNFWFDSEEKYYPANPLDFYYDKDLNELSGKEVVAKYDKLSLEEKLNNFRVFYKIDDSGNEIVYQYWLFYIFNDFDNKHYGDWESVFVFIDKNTEKINRVIGSTHIGNVTKIIFANNELSNPNFNNATILIERGSHANWIDGNNNGLVERRKDVTNWYNAYRIKHWSITDQLHGQKVFHDSPYYKLLPLEQIKTKFEKKYSKDSPLISVEKSPSLGILPININGKEFYVIPIGGEPPQNAWLKKEYVDSGEARPITFEFVMEKARNLEEKANNIIQTALTDVFNTTKNFIANPVEFLGANTIKEPQITLQSPKQKAEIKPAVLSEKLNSSGRPENSVSLSQKIKENPPQDYSNIDSDNDDEKDSQLESELALKKQNEITQSKIQSQQLKNAETEKIKNEVAAENAQQEKKEVQEQPNKIEKSDQTQPDNLRQISAEQKSNYSAASSPGAKNDYALPPLKITEVASGWNSGENEFIEIYNPSEKSININADNFQLKLVDSGNKISAKRINFVKNIILAKGYFLFSAGELSSDNQTIQPDATFSSQLTDVSGVIIADGDGNIKDKVSWGKSEKPAPQEAIETAGLVLANGLKTNQSLARKKDAQNNFIDTDNNSADFEIAPNPNPINSAGKILYFDTIAPDTILSLKNIPQNPTILKDASFSFESSEPDSNFECLLDVSIWISCASPQNYDNLFESAHEFQVRAIDKAGNADSSPAVFNWEVKSEYHYPKIFISEAQLGSNEFVELFNPTSATVSLNGWYFSYFSENRQWNNPYRNKPFPAGARIPGQKHFLIGLEGFPENNGNPNTDWQAYATGQLSDTSGAIAIFPWDPSEKTLQDAHDGKIDAIGWGNSVLNETQNATMPQNNQSLERRKDNQGDFIDTDNNSSDFQIRQNPNPINSKGETFQDLIPPDISFSLGEDYFITKTNFSLKWSSQAQDLLSFDIEYKIGASAAWQIFETASASNPGQKLFSAPQGEVVYYFRAKAKDVSGNQSDWQQIQAEVNIKPIVINEVAWSGTKASASDEWIELFSRAKTDMNINGWKLVSSDNSPNIIFNKNLSETKNATVSAGGFYLLERTDDKAISDISADWVGSFGSGGLSNTTCEVLNLYDPNNNLIDQTSCDGAAWPGGVASPNYNSMERINPNYSGAKITNWAANDGITKNGYDAGAPPSQIDGTPKSQNSRYNNNFQPYTAISSGFGVNTVLTKSSSPYVFSINSITVVPNIILTIEPGVVIKFPNQGKLEVRGRIISQGTETDPIIFTSIKDDNYGGDTNLDGSAALSRAGDWNYIYFWDTATGESVLDHIIVRYAGYQTPGFEYYWAAIKTVNTKITLTNSRIEYFKNRGVLIENSPSVFENNIIKSSSEISQSDKDCSLDDPANPKGAAIRGSVFAVAVKNNSFYNNRCGLELSDFAAPIEVSGNHFSGNYYPIYFNTSQPQFSLNTVNNNKLNSVIFAGGWPSGQSEIKFNGNIPFLITSMVVPSEKTLILDPGTIIKFKDENSYLYINGNLKAQGMPNNKIIITSLKDDEYGGDSNNDGLTSLPVPGSWSLINKIANSQDFILDNVIIRYGGYKTSGFEFYGGALQIEAINTQIKNSRIEYSKNKGVWIKGASSSSKSILNIDNTIFQNNDSGSAVALYVENADATITNSNFKNNFTGIFKDINSIASLDATDIFNGNILNKNW